MGIAEVCGKLLGEAVDLLASTSAAVKDTVSATTAYASDLMGRQPVVRGDSPGPAGAPTSIASSELNAELQVKLKEAQDRLAQMSTRQQELEFSEQQRAEAEQRAAALQQQLQQACETVEAARAEVSSLEARCDEIEDARHALAAEVVQLRDVSLRLVVLQEEHAVALKELEQARAAREELNAELEQLTEVSKVQEAQLAQQQPAAPEVSVKARTARGKRVAREAEQAAGEVQREPEKAEPVPPAEVDAASEPATTATGDEAPDNELSALERTVARHADARVRLRALQAIYTTADRPTVLANLVRALSDSSPVIRRMAVTCLGLMGAREALPELCSVADDPDLSVRKAYARALASCGGDAVVQAHLRPDSSRHIPSRHSTLATACWQQVRVGNEKLSQVMKES